jgi:YesN/AraC family two-component response regulator
LLQSLFYGTPHWNVLFNANGMMLHIRNMESNRCKTAVMNELNRHGILFNTLELGEVELKENISVEKLRLIDLELRNVGLEIIDDKKNSLIEKIKAAIHQLIYLSDDLPKPNYSLYISNKVNRDYTYLSNLFSREQGITIEKYIIVQRIERVKEMLVCSLYSLSEIAFKLQYSSVAHLSNQFKKITGLTPSHFKKLKSKRRIAIEDV